MRLRADEAAWNELGPGIELVRSRVPIGYELEIHEDNHTAWFVNLYHEGVEVYACVGRDLEPLIAEALDAAKASDLELQLAASLRARK